MSHHALVTWAWIVLAYFIVGGLWDVLDPRAITVKYDSAARAATALLAQIALVVVLLAVVAPGAAVVVGYVAALIILVLLSALANR